MEIYPRINHLEKYNSVGEWINLSVENPIFVIHVEGKVHEIDITPLREPEWHSMTVVLETEKGRKSIMLDKVDQEFSMTLIAVSRFYRLMPVEE